MIHLFDTHFHLDLLKNPIRTIETISNYQIYTLAMTNLPDLYRKERHRYNSKYINIALGMHPSLVTHFQEQIPLMWNLLPKARYIGEIGLDFSESYGRDVQIDFFEGLISRCRYDDDKVLSIHSRHATSEVISIIGEEFKFKPILHWFSGGRNDLNLAIERGYYISINLYMLKSKRFLQILGDVPLDKLLLETDFPFVGNKLSHADVLIRTIEGLSILLKMDRRKILDVMWNNYKKVFH